MDYRTLFITPANEETCFKAIAEEVHKWWGYVDLPTGKLGDEFSIFFGNTEWRFKITKYIPYEKISWRCIRANHFHAGLEGIREEWLNTHVVWEITKGESERMITFEHKGLNQTLNCFEVCKTGWDYYLLTSLRDYLETGKGNPFK